jgi:3',5'-cyclic AMP phosphodiesterase CpdA
MRTLALPTSHRVPGLDHDSEGAWRGPFFFFLTADPQFGMFAQDREWSKETVLFERTAEWANRLRPRFVVVAGDEVNQFPGGRVYEAQVSECKRIIGLIDSSIPVMCVAGNHDVGDTPDADTLGSYRRHFGDDWYGFWVGGVRFLVLNTCLFYDPSEAGDELERQVAWLREQLDDAAARRAKHVVILQHHPWFLEGPEDADQYFTIPLARRRPALQMLKAAGTRAVFAGHYHRNAYGRDDSMEMVTTSAVGMPLGKDPSGFRIVRVYEDRIEHDYYGMDEVPAQVML